MLCPWHGPVVFILIVVRKPGDRIDINAPTGRCSIGLYWLAILLGISGGHGIDCKVHLLLIGRHIERINHLHSPCFTKSIEISLRKSLFFGFVGGIFQHIFLDL